MTAGNFRSLLTSTGTLDKLKTAVKAADTNRSDDEGYWRPTVDKAGNGTAVIRFLPAPPPESLPFVSYYRHAFQGPGGWYIEKSRTSLGDNDPCSDFNSRLWATKDSALQDQVRKQARKLVYVSNIYVVQDKGNPENDGKVFLFRYGKKIFEKIKKAIEPEYAEDTPFDPFHLLEGANFRLRQKRQAGFPNYDDSVFEAPTPLLKGSEKAILSVVENLKSLTELTVASQFLGYEELKKRLDRAMGFDTAAYLTPNGNSVGGQNRSVGVVKVKPTLDDADEDEDVTKKFAAARTWTPPSVDDSDEDEDRLSKFDDE